MEFGTFGAGAWSSILRSKGRESDASHACVCQCFPSHVMVDASWPVGWQDRRHFRQRITEAIVKVIVSNLPGRMQIEFEISRHGGVVGRQELRLVFERGHDSFCLFAIKIDALLPRGF